ncbi:hypothetical protein Nepgr_020265 [Nepenthes gracilis]|uniref:Alpha/beta hydrolase fold-3 domain-containing protein n=1 Tax=Nepenthes gracilis TaxID=150966 RepID=A0AAD3SXB6_NEPGR|nr:hypothetical protein Nepgr_020265 [Nepenthes gracilis]
MAQDKKIAEEVSGWLRVYEDGSVDRTWRGPQEVKFMADRVTPHDEFINGVSTRDLTIEPNSGLRVRVYLPEKGPEEEEDGASNAKLPIILHFHGGGFCISQADWYMYYPVYSELARQTPAIVISVYLRLAPEHRLPAAIDDGQMALLWLSSLARAEPHEPALIAGADFKRVFLMGDSSGGNLVHEVAARGGRSDLGRLKLSGAIPIHPGFVRAERSRSELEQPESPFLTLDMVDKFLSLALPVGSTKDHPITWPVGPAAPPLRKLNLPPMLLCVAEKDLIRDTEMEYYEAMKAAGKDVELFVSGGMTHSFYLNRIAVEVDPRTKLETERLFQEIMDFINKH